MQNRRGTFLKSPPLTKEFLITEYVQNGKTTPQIMRELNCSNSKVVKALKKYGIHKPSHLKLKKGNAELKTKEALERMYYKEGQSIAQISERLGITMGAVTSLFHRRGITISKQLRYERVRKSSAKHVNLIATKRKRALSSHIYTLDERNRDAVTRVRSASQAAKRTQAELRAREILMKVEATFEEQVPFEFYNNKGDLIVACCPDFYLKRWGTHDFDGKIILQVDGALHGRREGIIERDIKQNKAFTGMGYTVIRICEDCLDEVNVLRMLEFAAETTRPATLQFHPAELIGIYHPAKYIPGPVPIPAELPINVMSDTSAPACGTKVIIGAKPGYPRVAKS